MSLPYIYLAYFILINFLIILNFDKIKIFHLILDKPDQDRKFHLKPTPLAGGLILMINVFIFFAATLIDEKIIDKEIIFKNDNEFYLFIIFSFLIFLLGYFDDRYNLSASLKFFLLSIIVLSILFFDPNLNIKKLSLSFINNEINLSYLSMLFTCFCFLVFINAFNMFDGIDLQASFYSLIILFIILFFYLDSLLIKILLINFIAYSYLNYKKKTFLGDSGTLLISFIIGYFFIKLYNLQRIEFADEIFIFMMIPGIDMIRLFFKRILIKQNPFHSDRLHLHHFLLTKFSNLKAIAIICFLITSPIILMLADINKLTIILSTVVVYSIIVKKIK